MLQWFKDVIGNILGRPSGRLRYMTCMCGHVTLSRLPDHSRCDHEGGCDATMKPLTAPLWGMFPLSDRVIQLQTQVYKLHMAQAQFVSMSQSFRQLNEDQNTLTAFFQAFFPEDLNGQGKSITDLAIRRLKNSVHQEAVR